MGKKVEEQLIPSELYTTRYDHDMITNCMIQNSLWKGK